MNYQNRDTVIKLMVVNFIGMEMNISSCSSLLLKASHFNIAYHITIVICEGDIMRYFQECVHLTNVIPFYASKTVKKYQYITLM